MKKTTLLLKLCVIACLIVPFMFVSCHKEDGNIHSEIIKNAVKDVDGNKYDAVKIGGQVWMAENLRTTKYPDGTEIPLVGSGPSNGGHRFYPNGEASNVKQYGYLYDWLAAMHGSTGSNDFPSGVQGICPDGWHLPSDTEWLNMVHCVEMQIEADELTHTSVIKALSSTKGWDMNFNSGRPGCEPSENNFSGFSAVPAGGYDGSYIGFGDNAYFWNSDSYDGSEALSQIISNNFDSPRSERIYKANGYSVRCVRN
ncbi:MAG: fibrobacter succinogenes major paralogous domain-containing protein [Bacteroidales bacterium]|nr:fibrobacter succinogenes major paralogous domain-containing protein [Bacteroidales bacterium]